MTVGTYYVYLPGFPFLLTPAMALDSWLFPGRLPLVVATCLGLAVLFSLALARLVEPIVGSQPAALLLSGGLTFVTPTFFSAFQVYPETTAALSVVLMLRVVLFSIPGWRSALVFGLAAALLPWLHTKYLLIWGASLIGLGFRAWQGRWERRFTLAATGLPLLSLALHSVYVFHISGSFLPDALWVLNGYPRGLHLLHPEAPRGLYYLLLDRNEGLLVYSPFFALALPGALALGRRSPFALAVTAATFFFYLLAAASHDVGGAGGWSPPGRYFVVLTPILALWLAAWLARPGGPRRRWAALVACLVASALVAHAMLAEPNWMYDRPAFLAGGVIDPSPLLRSRLLYPLFLIVTVVLIHFWERRSAPRHLLVLAAVALVTAAVVDARTVRESWLARGSREQVRPLLARPGRALAVGWTSCQSGATELALSPVGEGGPVALSLRGPGFERELTAPAAVQTHLRPDPRPLSRFGRGGELERLYWVEVSLQRRNERPVQLEVGCR